MSYNHSFGEMFELLSSFNVNQKGYCAQVSSLSGTEAANKANALKGLSEMGFHGSSSELSAGNCPSSFHEAKKVKVPTLAAGKLKMFHK